MYSVKPHRKSKGRGTPTAHSGDGLSVRREQGEGL